MSPSLSPEDFNRFVAEAKARGWHGMVAHMWRERDQVDGVQPKQQEK